jgi:hypothetical protein
VSAMPFEAQGKRVSNDIQRGYAIAVEKFQRKNIWYLG